MFGAWFNTKGAIGRLQYAASAVWYGVAGPFAMLVIFAALRRLPTFVGLPTIVVKALALSLITLGLAHSLISYVVVTIKRLRDLGQSGWWAVLLLIPGVSWLLAFAVLSLIPGVASRVQPPQSAESLVGSQV